MKTAETIDKTQPVELTVDMSGHPFVIRGEYESVAPIAEQVQEEDKHRPIRVKIPQAVIERPVPAPKTEQLQTLPLYGREASRASLKARMFDLRFGTDVYAQLVEKRRQERVLSMQMELGIISTVHCAKHEKLLSKV